MKTFKAALAAIILGAMLAVIGSASPASAAMPCDDAIAFPSRYTLTPAGSPVTIQVGLYHRGEFARGAVCVTTPVNTQTFFVQGQPYGSAGPAWCNPTGTQSAFQYTGYGTNLSGTGVAATAGAGVWSAPSLCRQSDGTYTFVIPIYLCIGTGCPVGTTEKVEKTGLVTANLTPTTTGPDGTASGATFKPTVVLWVDGVPFGGTGIPVAAGANTDSFRTAYNLSGGGTPVTIGGLGTYYIPPAVSVAYTGKPIAVVEVAGNRVPVQPSPTAYCVIEVGNTTNAPC